MKKILTECGLAIKLEDLYALVQESMDENFIDFVKSIVHTPGLRIAEGDEFLVYQSGDSLMVRPGAVVFQDYDIFVPGSGSSLMEISLTGVTGINEPGTEYEIYLVMDEETSHPQHQGTTEQAFMTVQQNVIEARLYPVLTAPTGNYYLLAMAEVQTDGSLDLTDYRFNSILKLASRYANDDWEMTTIPSTVEDVEARFLALEDFRQQGVSGHPINRQSLPVNRRTGPAIEVTWPAPSAKEFDAIGGVIYYKVMATPEVGGIPQEWAALSQIVPVDRIGVDSAPLGRIGCLMNCDLGVYYSVTVYRVSNILDTHISEGSTPVMVKAGMEAIVAAIKTFDLTVEYGLHSSDFLKISTSLEPSPDVYIRVFALEYASTPSSGIDDLTYLVYEGMVQDVIYRIEDKTNTGVTILVQACNPKHALIRGESEDFEFDTEVSDSETLVSYTIPESLTGWPGCELPAAQATSAAIDCRGRNPIITPNVLHLPHNRQVGDYIYLANAGGGAALANGWYKVVWVDPATSDIVVDRFGSGTGSGTIDIMGNAIVQNRTNPAELTIHANSPLQGKFAMGNLAIVDNSTIAGTLADGTYSVSDLDTNEIHLDDNTGPAGLGYCDIAAPTPVTLYTFSLDHDVVLSRIRVSGHEGQVLNDNEDEHGSIANYIVTASVMASDKEISVPRSGGAYKTFDTALATPIPAGDTISLKLERGDDTLDGIDASGYRVFLYFRKVL